MGGDGAEPIFSLDPKRRMTPGDICVVGLHANTGMVCVVLSITQRGGASSLPVLPYKRDVRVQLFSSVMVDMKNSF
jgi:hypothetical protein